MSDDVKRAKLSELIQDPHNANKGTERGAEMVRQSITKLGAGRSILMDKNGVLIAGNKTQQAAIDAGLLDAIVVRTDGNQLVVVQRTDLDLSIDAKAKELAVVDNRSSEIGLEWDTEILADLSHDVDLSDWFKDEELVDILTDMGDLEPLLNEEQDEETTADLIEQAEDGGIESRVKPGEIWQLGRHRIACGDSTDEGNVRKLLGGKVPGMVWSDPPYGFGLMKEGSTGKIGNSKQYTAIANDQDTDCARNAFKVCKGLSPVQLWWGANYFADVLPPSKCWVVWDKDHHGMTFADAELAWVSVDKPVRCFRHAWSGNHRASEQGEDRTHINQKPIALCEWAFEKYGSDTDLIFDPFLGSAPSIIAAQKMDGTRTVYGFELSEVYCTVIIERWEHFTGQVAELAGHL